jgi:hypothetical protein
MAPQNTVIEFPLFQCHVVDGDCEDPKMGEKIIVCGLHDVLHESISKAGNDVGWIKVTGYALLTGALVLIASVWGIFYPFMTKLSERQVITDVSMSKIEVVQRHFLEDLKRHELERKDADRASEQDRKEIHQYLEQLRRMENKAR